eukprot:CAMPEP_0194398848 /NCGR_PEP_ID=MMETSP0174-20130528/126335_1 /TAXON_ID=216777 /ORGANISM="Proboscia alata, Strain PI-D3" /LENGTH=79 /DNA_ID=CAMNT_0039195197 /DNA_START=940 /DNA_END=1179 /DNA_ORIENTATION=+
MTDLAALRRGRVMFPVPGPISRTTSVGFMEALATIPVTTAGFLRKCCPRDVLGAIRLNPPPPELPLFVEEGLECGAEAL